MRTSQIRTFFIALVFCFMQTQPSFANDGTNSSNTRSINQRTKESVTNSSAAAAAAAGLTPEQIAQLTPEQQAQLANATPEQIAAYVAAQEAEKKKKQTTMMFLGVGAVAGLGAIMYMASKKGSKAPPASSGGNGGTGGGSDKDISSGTPELGSPIANSYVDTDGIPAAGPDTPATNAIDEALAGGSAGTVDQPAGTSTTPDPKPTITPGPGVVTATPTPAPTPKADNPGNNTIKDNAGNTQGEDSGSEKPSVDPEDTKSWKVPIKQYTITDCMGSPRGGGRKHGGIDLAKPSGTPVTSIADGKVEKAGWLDDHCGYGVKIRHANGMASIYCHFKKDTVAVRAGSNVTPSTVIGQVGSTGGSSGPHLHLALKKANGTSVNPLDYMPQLFDHAASNPKNCKTSSGSNRNTGTSTGKE